MGATDTALEYRPASNMQAETGWEEGLNRMPADYRDYYRQIREVDIALVAERLIPDRITDRTSHTLYCDCPNHQSNGHKSLVINTRTQLWNCFGCGQGGDLLQLVEFIQFRTVTKGISGRMPESHRQARDWLAGLVGMKPLSKYGLSDEEITASEARHAADTRTFDALTAAAYYYHEALMRRPEVVRWLTDHYGISKEMIDDLKIGFASWKFKVQEDEQGVMDALIKQGFSAKEICSTGIIYISKEGQKYPLFQDRVVFPYWSGGRVVYMIGRRTEWTASVKFEKAKYKKLLVYREEHCKYVSPCIRNDYLYNEDSFLRRPEKLIVTEGVTDCISLMQHGFPVVSPVTVRIKNEDWDRVLGKARSVKTIYICQDNEISEAGISGALDTAARLKSQGIETRIISLPLGDKQKEARQQLADRFGITPGSGKNSFDTTKDLTPEQKAEVDRLSEDAKLDVNEYFASGHIAEEFQALMDGAVTPLMYGIQAIPAGLSAEDRNTALEPVLRRVAEETSLEQRRYLQAIKDRFGVSLTDLEKRVNQIRKEVKEANRSSALKRVRQVANADDQSCRAAINQVLMEMAMAGLRPDYSRVAETAFAWFLEHGARFYRNRNQEPYMFFQ
ncbi:MAG: toprim domain-containing protein, partial [Armatimonadota bacterium]